MADGLLSSKSTSMSKERYIIHTSWRLPTGEPLVIAVTKSEAMFHHTIQHLYRYEAINQAEYMTAEALIMREGFLKVA